MMKLTNGLTPIGSSATSVNKGFTIMRDMNKTFTVWWNEDNDLNHKAFPMVKGDPDHKAFNDAIVFAGVVMGNGNGVRIESRQFNDKRNAWDIEQVWPNDNTDKERLIELKDGQTMREHLGFKS